MKIDKGELLEASDTICTAINVLVDERKMRIEDAARVVFSHVDSKRINDLNSILYDIKDELTELKTIQQKINFNISYLHNV